MTQRVKRVCLQCRRPRFDPWVGKIPWRREWQPTLVFLPGKSRGQRSWAGYNPWGHGVGHDLATKALQLCFGPWCWLTCSVCGLWFLMAPVFSSFLLPLPVCCRASCGTDSAWYGPSLCFHCFGSHWGISYSLSVFRLVFLWEGISLAQLKFGG